MGSLEDFELLAMLGRGAMGEVWRARHKSSGVMCAVKWGIGEMTGTGKSLPGGSIASEAKTQVQDVMALSHEIRAVAALDHEHIAPIYDQGISDGKPWFASGYAPYGDLRGAAPTDWNSAASMLEQMLEAFAHAHARGVIHRDLKPANVLVVRPGALWLTDFGIAWSGVGARQAGTPKFMAPEQVRGWWRHFGPWTDLYSLGCLAWWMITGRSPFGHLSAKEAARAQVLQPLPPLVPRFDLPPGLPEWLGFLLAKHPHGRFASAADALHALHALKKPASEAGGTIVPALLEDTDTFSFFDDEAFDEPVVAEGGTAPLAPFVRPHPPLLGAQRYATAGLALFGVRPVPMVGREAAFEALASQLERVVTQGEAALVCVEGPPGVGCSYLIERFMEQAAEVGAAQPLSLSGATASDLCASMVVAMGLADLPGIKRAKELERWIQRHPGVLEDDVEAVLAEDGSLGTVARILAAWGRGRAVVVHLVGPLGPALLAALHATDGVVLLLAERGGGGNALVLEPLTPPQVGTLTGAMVGLDAKVAIELEAQVGGMPRDVVSLLRHWVATGVLRATEDGVELGDDPFAALARDGLQGQRVKALGFDRHNKDVLGVLALAGPSVRKHHVRGLQRGPEVLDALAAAGLATIGAEMVWLDPLVADWLREAIPPTRVDLFFRASAWTSDEATRADLLFRAGRIKASALSFRAAVRGSSSRHAFLSALWLRLEPELAGDLLWDCKVAYLGLLKEARELERCAEGYESLRVLANSPVREVQILRGLADCNRLAGNNQLGMEQLEEAIIVARRKGVAKMGELQMLYGLAVMEFNYDEALLVFEEAEELCASEGDDEPLGKIAVSRAAILARRGEHALAVEWYQRALELIQGVPNRVAAWSMASDSYAALGQMDEAEVYATRAVDEAYLHAAQHIPITLLNLVNVQLERGRIEEAWNTTLRAQQAAQRSGKRISQMMCWVVVAKVAADKGDLETVGHALEELAPMIPERFADNLFAEALEYVADRCEPHAGTAEALAVQQWRRLEETGEIRRVRAKTR